MKQAMSLALALWPLLAAAPAVQAQEPAPPEPESRQIDRVVAVVGDRVITASDVALEELLFQRDPPRVTVLRVGASDPLDRLVEAALIRPVAGDVSLYQPSKTEVRERLVSLRATWEDPAEYQVFLATFGLDESALSGMLYARLVVERYVQRNFGLAAEADGLTPEEARASLDAWLAARRRTVPVRKVGGRGPEAR